jgi:anti-sigma factor RsiW
MTCSHARRELPGYLDGAIHGNHRAQLSEHLRSCAACREELESYCVLNSHLSQLAPVAAPPDLAIRIRVQASFGRSRWLPLQRLWDRAVLVFRNILEPLAVPAAGGVVAALAVFTLLVQNILVGVPVGGIVPGDLPLNLVQPAELESLAPFPVPGVVGSSGHEGPLLLQATLDSNGAVLFYTILSGPNDAAVQRQIDQVLMFSRFRPQINFGRPIGGGHVLLSFSEVRVHG